MKNKTTKNMALIAFLMIGFQFTACVSKEDVPPPPLVNSACKQPIIIAKAFDQSGSMNWSGTPSIKVDDFKPLLELVSKCGGEIGITFVRANSAKPIERFPTEEPPPSPVKPIQKEGEEDYEFVDRMTEYKNKLIDWHKDETDRQTALKPKIKKYLDTLTPLLNKERKGATDLWSAVTRLNVFLSEGDATWQVKPKRYLIIVSDAQDTVGKPKNKFMNNINILWVNGNASDKELKDFPYQRFESFRAAVAEIVAIEKGGEKDAETK